MATAYEPFDSNNKAPTTTIKEQDEEKPINTTARYIWYGSALASILIASLGFWVASRYQPLLLSLSASHTVLNNAKSMTFVWTLIGTILAFATGTLFNQLLKISLQQTVAEQGVKIGLIEFWTRVYSRKWLHDHRKERFLLSAFSVIFAIACGLLVSAYTGLITPTYVYLNDDLWSSELDLSSEAFWQWYQDAGERLLNSCGQIKTYGKGHNALTLALCPQTKDPLPYVSAGIASIEAKYADYDPTTSVLGMSFNGTTKGVLPHGWNTIPFFNTFLRVNQPPVLNYNYSVIQQGISTNVTCSILGESSNITWLTQGDPILTTYNGATQEEIYPMNITFYNEGRGIDYQDNYLISGSNFVATFSDVSDQLVYRLELANYGTYKSLWLMPNMSCTLAPYLTNVNVTYNNATGLFAGEVTEITGGLLRIPYDLNEVNNWMFRVMVSKLMGTRVSVVAWITRRVSQREPTLMPLTQDTIAHPFFRILRHELTHFQESHTGSMIINSIIALQNTPSYERGVFANVTIDWPSTMELLFQGMTEYHATRLRMIMSAEINSTNVQPSGFKPVVGQVSSWRLGYNGETAPIATLFPLQGFILVCAIVVVVIGSKTGVKHVSRFDPTNTTHLIVASAQGASRGQLHTLRGEDAIHADAKALNLKIEYNHLQGFQEASNLSNSDYTELSDLDRRDADVSRRPKSNLLGRIPFKRTDTR